MGRLASRKSGAYTRAEIQRRYRQRQKRNNPSADTLRRQQRRAELGLAARTTAATALGTKLYVDPPWRYEVYSRITGLNRAAEEPLPDDDAR